MMLATLSSASKLAGSEPPSEEQIRQQATPVPDHPRLFWSRQDEAGVRAKVAADPQLKAVWEAVRLTADHMLKEPPVVYRKDGRRLLGRSREALGRTMHLGFAYRMTGEKRYSERAMVEMKAMAEMQDWNPSHFLDTAEMTMAIAVGYDWLYDQLSPELREASRKAIEAKGLSPYLKAKSRLGWERGGNNWNQVCHAGMMAGALALLEDDPGRAAEVVRRALVGLPNAMKVYDPDGTYPEGPGYWNYGTSFNVMILSMLESVFGTDFDLSRSPGFLKSGEFMLNIIGPTRRTFNFSDCGSGTGFSPAMTWFAARAGRPDLLWFETELLERELAGIRETTGRRQGDRYFPLVLLWAKTGTATQGARCLELAWPGPESAGRFPHFLDRSQCGLPGSQSRHAFRQPWAHGHRFVSAGRRRCALVPGPRFAGLQRPRTARHRALERRPGTGTLEHLPLPQSFSQHAAGR